MVNLIDQTGQTFTAISRAEWNLYWADTGRLYENKHFGSVPHQTGFPVMADDNGKLYVVCEAEGLKQLEAAGVRRADSA